MAIMFSVVVWGTLVSHGLGGIDTDPSRRYVNPCTLKSLVVFLQVDLALFLVCVSMMIVMQEQNGHNIISHNNLILVVRIGYKFYSSIAGVWNSYDTDEAERPYILVCHYTSNRSEKDDE